MSHTMRRFRASRMFLIITIMLSTFGLLNVESSAFAATVVPYSVVQLTGPTNYAGISNFSFYNNATTSPGSGQDAGYQITLNSVVYKCCGYIQIYDHCAAAKNTPYGSSPQSGSFQSTSTSGTQTLTSNNAANGRCPLAQPFLTGLEIVNGDGSAMGTFQVNQNSTYTDPGPPASPATCSLSDEQLAQLARAAGFTDAQIPTAVAIAIAESSGRVGAYHVNTTNGATSSYDIGLWQVNDVAHSVYDRNKLAQNPLYNATAAHDIFVAASNAWTPWNTFNNGKYVQYMQRGNAAVNSTGTLPLVDCNGATGNVSDPNNNGDPSTTDSNGTTTCWGWNILNGFKCALKWAFVPGAQTLNQWQTTQNNMTNKPPFSLLGSCFSYLHVFTDNPNDWIAAYNAHQNDLIPSSSGITRTNQGSDSGTYSGSYVDDGKYHFPLIAAASDEAQHSAIWQGGLTLIKIFLWSGFAWWAFHRISHTFGGKTA